jgi:sugar lactone lactonase YvrE
MLVKRIPTSRFWKFTAGLVVLSWSIGSTEARAQAPYLIPYTISTIAGGGTAPTVGAVCAGSTATPTAEDTLGDGCPASSASVVSALVDLHDVGVDPLGNVVYIDNETLSAIIRRIDAHSSIVNVLAGSNTASKPCSGTIDAYGDGCPANDGKGNVTSGLTTSKIPTIRGLAVGKNGDVYLADYSQSLVHKISASTGNMTLVAGVLTGSGSSGKGGGSADGYTGDGSAAVGAELRGPRGVAVDAAGNVYIADTANNVIRMVNVSGIISTVVGKNPGTGAAATAGATGDGGPATSAQLSGPEDVEIDANGDIFIGDSTNDKVRVVYGGGTVVAGLITATNPSVTSPVVGDIYTVAGGGAGVYTPGSIVLATSVAIGNPRKIALDARGNLYIADNGNDVVWFIDAATGYMRDIAGTFGKTAGASCTGQTNTLGDGCQATQAVLSPNSSMGVAVGPQGDVYVSDSGDSRVRKVALNTSFPTVASGSSATQTLLVHFAKLDGQAVASPFTIAGSPDFAVSGTPVCTTNADNTTDCTVSVIFTPARPGPDAGTLVVKSKAGLTTQLALSGTGTASSVALDPGNTVLLTSSVSAPGGIAQDGAGNTYIADTGNNRVVEYTAGGTSSVVAGTGTSGYSGDGAPSTAAKLAAPKAVAVTPDGAVYIADSGNNVIRRIDPVTSFISTFAGGASTVCSVAIDSFGDGCLATSAKFFAPAGIVSDPIGNLYVSDTGNNLIRELSTTGYVFLIGGGTTACTTSGADIYGNGCAPTQAIFKSPTALQIDNNRNLYIADTGNNEVRKITVATNLISLFAGTCQSGGSGNGGAANNAQVNGPTGLALDAANNLYIADTGNHVVRVVAASGTINTVVGTLGSSGTGTVPGTASGVLLNLPGAVVASGIGKLYVLDSGNNRLFSLDRGSVSVNFGRTNDGSNSPTAAIQETSTGSYTAALGYQSSATGGIFATTGSTAFFTLTASGSNGCISSSITTQTLAPGAVCNLSAQFIPTAVGPVSATYTESNGVILTSPIPAAPVINSPAPAITLSGTGAVLTKTTLTTAVTTPATGSPQYSISFVVTATLHPAVCDPTAPNCSAAGTITFYVDGTQVGLPVAVSNTSITSSNVITASATINGQSVGNHAVVAIYSGDTYYASSTAPTLTVAVAQGATLTVAVATPATGTQFTNLTLSAQVTSATGTIPTGSVAFYAGTTLLKSGPVDPGTGIATIADVFTAPLTVDNKGVSHKIIATVPNSFGLSAGTYSLTAVYSGDSNYATSTSLATTLTITPDAPAFAIAQCITTDTLAGCTPPAVGTAQGSTAYALVYVIPSNTLNGTLSFSCSGLPANSVCTFGQPSTSTSSLPAGTTITFTPVSGNVLYGMTVPGASVVAGATPSAINSTSIPSIQVTLWTDANSNVNSASNTPRSISTLAGILGWPMLLGGFTVVLGFRKRLRNSRLLAGLALFALLTGSATVLTGCTSALGTSGQTPVGSYTVTLTATGPNGLVQTTPITFTVGAGLAGQL